MHFHGNEVKTRVRNAKKRISCKPASLLFNLFYSKDGLKGQFIALSDDIE